MTPDQLPVDEFIEEAEDLLQDLETALLELESEPQNRELVGRVFRDVHTLKGGAGMVAQTELANYTHQLESMLDRIRSGQLECTPQLISLLLKSLDCLQSFIRSLRGEGEINQALKEETLHQIQSFDSTAPEQPTAPSSAPVENAEPEPPAPSPVENLKPEPPAPSPVAEHRQAYLLTLKFSPDLFQRGGDPLLLLRQLDELGEMAVIVHPGKLPDLEDFDPARLYLWWSLKLVTESPLTEIENILVFFQEGNDLSIESIDTPPEDSGVVVEAHQRMIRQAEDSASPLEPPHREGDLDTEMLTSEPDRSTPEVETTSITVEPKVQDTPENTGTLKPMKETQVVQSIRVHVDKLDKLQNLVGETVINQSRLMRLSEEIIAIDENLGEMVLQFVEENEQSVRELQDQILQVRMVQVGSIFTPMKRIVRDFAVTKNKQIRLGISGADTELDKTVTEQLHGPLVHLIRNAMDHGIEEPEIRQQHGKDPTGTIALRASHQEGFVIVEIEDDGKGMDPQKIMETGVRKGLVSAGDQLSEQEAFQLIFQPGFTTTTEVTSVSGRGVGMDSVKREIEALLGNIEIHSNVGKGTLVRLKLPLTLAIIEGMIVRVGVQIFILPLLAVLEALRPRPEQIKRLKRRGELIDLRGEYIPLIRLHERLKLDGATEDPSRGLVIVIQQGSQKHCMLVDEIIDQRPVVIKNLEDHFIQVPGIAGATIMGDGSVSFILDVSTLAA
jgi:two-component system chemotaxis sensor kinase CheA